MTMHKIARMAAVAGMALTSIAVTTAAHAEEARPRPAVALAAGCPGSGQIDRNYTCTSLSSGVLFHRKYTNDVASTWYTKTSGGTISARLGYNRGGSSHYGAKFSQSSGTTKTSTWNGVDYCSSTVGMLTVDGQQTFQTPLASCS
ncbi:hypothetical protein AB0F64_06515 [Streptomyces sp. NPDC026294]|uniref:hypothetical protein n=1 Tax=Streptomyces sp. NPDC026294 TaxID=3155362 RepID=UPI0033FD8C93